MDAPRCVLVRDPRIPAGGFETWVEALAKGLPQRGVLVTVLVPGGGIGQLGDAEIIPIAAETEDDAQAAHVVSALAALATRGETGVFFTMGYRYVNVAGLNLQQSPWVNVPVLHGRDPKAFDWLVAGPPRKIVSPSAEYGQTIRTMLQKRVRWFRAIGKVVVIPHGVPLPDVTSKLARPMSKPIEMVTALRLTDDIKRPFDLLRIAARARDRGVDLRLTIAGTGPAEERMRREAPPNVEFAGVVPHESMSEFLLDADIYLSTSETEAFGLSIAEALAAGCAVVAADAEGPVRTLVDEETGRRVAAGDIDAFVDAIVAVAPDARRLGRAGHERVAREFPEERMLAAYASLIASLCHCVKPNRDWHPPHPMLTSPSDLTLPPLRVRLRRALDR